MKALLITLVCAAAGFAQGALPENSSYFSTPTYPDVQRVIPGSKGTANGWLKFDAKNEMRFIPRKGEELRIPYRSIKALQYERATQPIAEKSSKSKFSAPVKVNFAAKHQIVIRYDVPQGHETATLWLDRSNYQMVLGTLKAKTGLTPERTGINGW